MPRQVEGLLERDGELGRLEALIAAARDGSGSAALIEGEPGIGKTTLLESTQRRAAASGLTVLTARAGELESEFAWGVVRQLLESAVAAAPASQPPDLLDGAAGLAAPALGLEGEGGDDASFSTLHGLYWLTVNLAQRGPLMLAIDDLQWADLPSLRFVAHLVPRLAELPVSLVAASRPPDSRPATDPELLSRIAQLPEMASLRPDALSLAGSTSLVQDAMSSDASDGFCLACHEMSGGNPFLLRELIRELVANEVTPTEESVDHVRRISAGSIAQSVLLRLAQFPATTLALARAVAVLGAEAELRVAGELAGIDVNEAADASEELIRARILNEGELLRFVHPLVRSAIYGDLAAPQRGLWHRRAAELFAEEGAPMDRVAAHLLASLPERDPWTIERLREAAEEAAERGAPEIATDYLRRALAEPPPEADRVQLLFELGQVEAVQNPEESLSHLRAAHSAAQPGPQRAAVALPLGEVLTLSGSFAEGVSVLGMGIEDLGESDQDELRSLLEATRLGAARWDPDTQELRHALIADLREREAAGEDLHPLLRARLAIEGTAEGIDRQAAVEQARVTLAKLGQLTGTARAIVPEAILALAFADLPDEARRGAEAWIGQARNRAWRLGVALGTMSACRVALYQGEIGAAVAHGREATELGREIHLGPVAVGFLVEVLAERAEIEEGAAELAKVGLDGDLPPIWPSAPALFGRGQLKAVSGDHSGAAADLLAAGELADRWRVLNPGMMPWRSQAALSLAAIGRRDRAIELADAEIGLARRWGTPRAIGVALAAAGGVRGDQEGAGFLEEALAQLDPGSAPLERAKALTDLGSLLRRSGNRAEARDHLRHGLDIAQGLGAIATADRAREELKIAGARPRRDALRGRDALTPSELRVAQLAAEGRTNREIAESLFVTLRTVEAHLTSSYSKLEIGSRRDLGEALEAQAKPGPRADPPGPNR